MRSVSKEELMSYEDAVKASLDGNIITRLNSNRWIYCEDKDKRTFTPGSKIWIAKYKTKHREDLTSEQFVDLVEEGSHFGWFEEKEETLMNWIPDINDIKANDWHIDNTKSFLPRGLYIKPIDLDAEHPTEE